MMFWLLLMMMKREWEVMEKIHLEFSRQQKLLNNEDSHE